MSTYREILRALDPRTIGEKVSRRILEAQRSFQVSFTVSSYYELVECVSSYYAYLHGRYLGMELEMPHDWAMGEVLRLLRVENLEQFYDNSVRGIDRGVFEVIDVITKRYLENATNHYVKYTLDTIIEPLNYEEAEAMMTEYVQTYGQYLGFDLRHKGLLVSRWKEILSNHAQVLAQIRSQVGSF